MALFTVISALIDQFGAYWWECYSMTRTQAFSLHKHKRIWSCDPIYMERNMFLPVFPSATNYLIIAVFLLWLLMSRICRLFPHLLLWNSAKCNETWQNMFNWLYYTPVRNWQQHDQKISKTCKRHVKIRKYQNSNSFPAHKPNQLGKTDKGEPELGSIFWHSEY